MANDRQARLNQAMRPWSGEEIRVFLVREARFAGLGLSPAAASGWGDRLALRDQQGDDLRACIECSHALPGWRCAIRQPAGRSALIRCPTFNLSPL